MAVSDTNFHHDLINSQPQSQTFTTPVGSQLADARRVLYEPSTLTVPVDTPFNTPYAPPQNLTFSESPVDPQTMQPTQL